MASSVEAKAETASSHGQKEWASVQQKTFTRWVNTHLTTRGAEITDLATDLCDGVRLIALLEVLSNKSVGKYNVQAKIQIQKIENLNAFFKLLAEEGVKVVNIGSQDIEGGNLKIILGLIWTLILHYQLSRTRKGAKPADAGSATASSASQQLLSYVQGKCTPSGVVAADFADSFRDGRVISALTNSLAPERHLIDLSKLGNAQDAVEHAMTVAEREFHIPRVMDATDMVNSPDARSIMTYVSYFQQKDAELQEQRLAKATVDPAACRVVWHDDSAVASGQPLVTGHVVSGKVLLLDRTGETITDGSSAVVTCQVSSHGRAVPAGRVVCGANKQDDGSWHVQLVATEPGTYECDVFVNGARVANSPFTFDIAAAKPKADPAAERAAAAAKASLIGVGGPSSAVVEWYAQAEHLTGFTSAQALGRKFPAEVLDCSGSRGDAVHQAIQSVLSGQVTSSQAVPCWFRHASGAHTTVPALVTVSARLSPQGIADGYWCTVQDLASVQPAAVGADASRSVVEWSAGDEFRVHDVNTCSVHLRNAAGQAVPLTAHTASAVRVSFAPAAAELAAHSVGGGISTGATMITPDGAASVAVTPAQEGSYVCDITVNGQSVTGYPKSITVQPLKPSAPTVQIDSSSLALLFAVDRSGAVTEWNEGIETISGYERSLVMGTLFRSEYIQESVDPAAGVAFDQMISGVIANANDTSAAQRVSKPIALPLRCRNGEVLLVLTAATARRSPTGDVTGAWCVGLDASTVSGSAQHAAMFRVSADGKILYASAAAAALLDKKASALHDRVFVDVVLADTGKQRKHVQGLLDDLLKSDDGKEALAACGKLELVLAAGEDRVVMWQSVRKCVVAGVAGPQPAAEIVLVDVTSLLDAVTQRIQADVNVMWEQKTREHDYDVKAARDDALAESAAELEKLRAQPEAEKTGRSLAERELANHRLLNDKGEEAKQQLLATARAADQKVEQLLGQLKDLGAEMKELEERCEALTLQVSESEGRAEAAEEELAALKEQSAQSGTPHVAPWREHIDGAAMRFGFQPKKSYSGLEAPPTGTQVRKSVWERIDSLITDLQTSVPAPADGAAAKKADPSGALSPRGRPTSGKAGQPSTNELLQQYMQGAGSKGSIGFKPTGSQDTYWFGSRKVHLVVINSKLLVRVGGGFSTIEDFVANNTPAEAKKMAEQLVEQGKAQKHDGYKTVSFQTSIKHRAPQ